MAATQHPVDAVLPPRQLFAFGLQHLLVMIAFPITAVFVIGRALNLPAALTVSLISATLLACGLGTLVRRWACGGSAPGCPS